MSANKGIFKEDLYNIKSFYIPNKYRESSFYYTLKGPNS